jgi:F0F1-type ATP synthase membrane subunit b/b'
METFENPLLQLFISSIIIFLVLWQILSRYFFKTMFQLLELREARTTGDEKRALLLRKDTQKIMEFIENEVKTAKLLGIKGRNEITAVAKAEAEKIIEAARLEASRELENARKQILILKERARQELLSEAKKLADETYLRLLNENASHTIIH